MWSERIKIHVDLYAEEMCCSDITLMKNMSLRSKLWLKCRQEFCAESKS